MKPAERLSEERPPFTDAEKRPYHPPELTDLGALPDVTHTSSTYNPGGPDGGSFPNIYAS
jgi:hypothetical protein